MSDPSSVKSQSISVLIPTWRRPDELAVCLAALRRQTLPANQVIVTVRADDDITHARLEQLERDDALPTGFQKVTVGAVPLTASMNAGLAATTGDYVALTDDDSEPRTDWLAKLAAVLNAQPDVGGVGGRDWQPHDRRQVEHVGTVSWYGRVVGNHHIGVGPARDVDILKGVNACFRGETLRRIGFDERLRGRGNVTHWEISLCLTFRREGWRLVYDPAIAVEHYPATRHDGDVNTRGGFEPIAYGDGVYNETVALLDHFTGGRRLAVTAYALVVGTMATPGLVQAFRRFIQLREKPAVVIDRVRAVWAARFAAVADRRVEIRGKA